jgi:hypothetical protein
MRYQKKAVKPKKHIKPKPVASSDFKARIPLGYTGKNLTLEGKYSDLAKIGACAAGGFGLGSLACVATGLYNISKFV